MSTTMPHMDRLVIKLYFIHNVSIEEIATISQRKVDKVRSLILCEKDSHYRASVAEFPENPKHKIGRPKKILTEPPKPKTIRPNVKPQGIAFGYGHKLRF